MEAAVRPVHHPRNVPVLHGVEMDVVNMLFEIRITSDGVLPIATLPNAFFALVDLAFRPGLGIDTAGEATLDETPPGREVRVVLRQRPERMNMIG